MMSIPEPSAGSAIPTPTRAPNDSEAGIGSTWRDPDSVADSLADDLPPRHNFVAINCGDLEFCECCHEIIYGGPKAALQCKGPPPSPFSCALSPCTVDCIFFCSM